MKGKNPTGAAPNQCWFPGTSQSAAHVAGLAALLVDRYDDPNNRRYTAEDLAQWLQDTAIQQDFTSNPNNIWGHGFAFVPNPAPLASLSPVPASITLGQTQRFTVTATNVGTGALAGANITVNNSDAEDGNLSLTTTCQGAIKGGANSTNTQLVNIRGCTVGHSTVRIYQAGSKMLLKTYDVTVEPANSNIAPVKNGTTTSQRVKVGENHKVNVYNHFSGLVDSYMAATSNPLIATGSMHGSVLNITGVSAGTTTISVRATNPGGTVRKPYSVTVEAGTTMTSIVNPLAPSSNAGMDQTVSFISTVSLFGTGSPSDDDDDVTYSWIRVSGPVVALKAATTGGTYRAGLGGNAAKFVAPSSSGTLVFRLTVTDTAGRSSSDDVTITVGP